MKYFRLLTLCFIILTLILLSSCGSDEMLDTPRGVEIEYETLTLKWDAVENAKIYEVCIESEGKDEKMITVSKNYYLLADLSEGEYSLKVKAVTNDDEIKDSLYSAPIEFEREKETGLKFKLINGGTEYEVSDKGEATGVIEIPSSYRKKPVTAIGNRAFFNKSDVTEVKLPGSIKKIGDFAFSNCSYLEKINLPEGISTLGESAFSGCRILGVKLELPPLLEKIPNGAFAYCAALEEVIFGEKIVSIGDNAFTDCSKIKSVVFPNSLETIGNFAFAACADIESAVFGDGLIKIGNFAFSKAVSLETLNVPDSVKVIGEGAFYHCDLLASVELGEGVEEIGNSAFFDTKVYSNSQTNEIYIGNWFVGLKDTTVFSVEFKEETVGIANNAFYGNQYLQSIELPNSVKHIGTLAFAGSEIVSIVMGSGVVRISDQAFLSCSKLVTVILGAYDYVSGEITASSLRCIGNYAFMNCSYLERIDIPETVNEIGSYAFRNTGIFSGALTGLVYADNWLVDFNDKIQPEVTLARGTVGIARYAFYNCRALTKITVPGTVKYIGKGAFYSCTELESVTLPDALKKIENYTFYSCAKLKLTSLPPMLEEIGKSAFYMTGTVVDYNTDTDEDTLVLPSGLKIIGDFAFFGSGYRSADGMDGNTKTGGIDVIIIGDSVEYIGRCAFYNFSSLRSVTIGSAAEISDKAFYECASLEEVTVLDGLVSVGDMAFYRCDSLKTVKLPSTLKNIGDYAFYRCEALKEAILGNSVEKIGSRAFMGSKALELLFIPATVVSIGEEAFRDCEKISTVILGEFLEEIGAHAFYSCDNLTVYTVLNELPGEKWSGHWNSSFRPVVWGCELSEDGSYITSVTGNKSFVTNVFMNTELASPVRLGYTFDGWSCDMATEKIDYSPNELSGIENGVKVYSVWKKN